MGPNGSGKSTLAKLLAGLLTPVSGSLQILNCDLRTTEGRAALRGQVGIVFQYPDEQMVATTVEREIAFASENLARPPREIRAVVDELMKRFDLTTLAQRPPHLLSGGEKQRLALASVLAMQPDLLIFDEVTSLLDPQNRREVLNYLKQLKNQNTLLFITQFPEETLFADRLLILKNGSIAEDMSPVQFFQEPHLARKYSLHFPAVFALMNAAECAEIHQKK